MPISWTVSCQSAVSHSSTEAQNFSLDAGLRLEAILALNFWDMVIDVLEPSAGRNPMPKKTKTLMADKNTMLIMFLRTHVSLANGHLFLFLKTTMR